ncbi:MAG: HNH endonuclease [Akkermansiaceae bacterium]|nr:HNH endonuclease [Akkermansiaceae bacterium]
MRFWWVNHKQTFRHEVENGYIWCPKVKRNGVRNHYYETLREVRQGDLIFSFAFAHLQAVGPARLACYSCPKPNEFGKVGDAWNDLGWRVDVGFRKFRTPLRIKDVIAKIARLLPGQYSPIQENGHGNQVAYLSEIPRALATALIDLAEPALHPLLNQSPFVGDESPTIVPEPAILFDWEEQIQAKILDRLDLTETTRKALIAARRGQGRFRNDVHRIERECRITRVSNSEHLIASHIKPWRESNDEERLCGANGLLLTPSIDHLFDRGFISFGDEGEVLVSPIADGDSVSKMGVALDRPLFAGKFNDEQKHFLDYHRKQVFLKAAI